MHSSEQWNAIASISAGIVDPSSQAQTMYSDRRRRKAEIRQPNLSASSTLIMWSSLRALALSGNTAVVAALPPIAGQFVLGMGFEAL